MHRQYVDAEMILLVVLIDGERQNGHAVGGGTAVVSESVGNVISIGRARLVSREELPQLLVFGKVAHKDARGLDSGGNVCFTLLHVPEREARFGADERIRVDGRGF